MTDITIYTGSSCQTQTRIGGWGAVLTCGDHRKKLANSTSDTTANAMALTAACEGLGALKAPGQTVTLFTDSTYVARGVNEWMTGWIARGWKTKANKPVANRALWERLHGLMANHTVTVTHISREGNTEADKLAHTARISHGAEENEPSEATPQTLLMIAGSREATPQMIDYAKRAVRRARERGFTVLVGDNPHGVDLAVVRECRRLRVPVIVAGADNVPRNGGCRHGRYVKVARDTYTGSGGAYLNRYTVRDQWMADSANIGLFVWNGDSPGTKAGHDYMTSRGKTAHLIDFTPEILR